MDHKEAAKQFLQLASSGEVARAYDRFVSATFKHHNPYFAGDAASLRAGMEEAHQTRPNKGLEVEHAIEDGDLVAVHSHVTRVDRAAPEVAVVHIFRFEDDRIAELWDIGQELPEKSPNANGPF